MEYHIGDRVEYLSNSFTKKGTLGTVESIHGNGYPRIQWDNGKICDKNLGHGLGHIAFISSGADEYKDDFL